MTEEIVNAIPEELDMDVVVPQTESPQNILRLLDNGFMSIIRIVQLVGVIP